MTLEQIVARLREKNPGTVLSDDQLLMQAAEKNRAILDRLPELKSYYEQRTAPAPTQSVTPAYTIGYDTEPEDTGSSLNPLKWITDTGGNAIDALQRGFAGGMQDFNVLQGAADATNAQDIANWQEVIDANPVSKEFLEFQKAEGFWDSAKAFGSSPVRIISEIIFESLGRGVPSLVGTTVGGAVGAAKGSVAGLPGAAVGAGIGAFTGTMVTETASNVFQSLVEAGMDPRDPESIQQFFNNPTLLSEAQKKAVSRGIPVALFDGLSAGLAGKFGGARIAKAIEEGAQMPASKLIRYGLQESAAQAGLGSTGELAGQLASGDEISGKDIFLEGIAEVGTAPIEVLNNTRDIRRAAAEKRMAKPVADETDAGRASLDVSVGEVKPYFDAASVPPPTDTPEAMAQADAFADETKAVTDADKRYLSEIVKQLRDRRKAATPETTVEPVGNDTAQALYTMGVEPEEVAGMSQPEAENMLAELEAQQTDAIIENEAARQIAYTNAANQMAAPLREETRQIAADEAAQAKALIKQMKVTKTAAKSAAKTIASTEKPAPTLTKPLTGAPAPTTVAATMAPAAANINIKETTDGLQKEAQGQNQKVEPAPVQAAAPAPVQTTTPTDTAAEPAVSNKPVVKGAALKYIAPLDVQRLASKLPLARSKKNKNGGAGYAVFKKEDGTYEQVPIYRAGRAKPLEGIKQKVAYVAGTNTSLADFAKNRDLIGIYETGDVAAEIIPATEEDVASIGFAEAPRKTPAKSQARDPLVAIEKAKTARLSEKLQAWGPEVAADIIKRAAQKDADGRYTSEAREVLRTVAPDDEAEAKAVVDVPNEKLHERLNNAYTAYLERMKSTKAVMPSDTALAAARVKAAVLKDLGLKSSEEADAYSEIAAKIEKQWKTSGVKGSIHTYLRTIIENIYGSDTEPSALVEVIRSVDQELLKAANNDERTYGVDDRAKLRRRAPKQFSKVSDALVAGKVFVNTLSQFARRWGIKVSLKDAKKDIMSRAFDPKVLNRNAPEVRNAEGKLLAPNGRPSKLNEFQWHQVRTPEFKAWFGDWEKGEGSKVVDAETGEPLVVYHGGNSDIVMFDKDKRGETTGAPSAKRAFFFTDDPSVAGGYADLATKRKSTLPGGVEDEIFARYKLAVKELGARAGNFDKTGRMLGYSELNQAAEAHTDSIVQQDAIFDVVEEIAYQVNGLLSTSTNQTQETKEFQAIVKALRNLNDSKSRLRGLVYGDGYLDTINAVSEAMVEIGYYATKLQEIDAYELIQNYTLGLKELSAKADHYIPKLRNSARKLRVLHENLARLNPGKNLMEVVFDVLDLQAKRKEELLNARAAALSDGGQNVVPVFLSMRNPRTVDYSGSNYRETSFRDALDASVQSGGDGASFINVNDSADGSRTRSDIYAVFEPTQIKSAIGNTGSFDPNNPDIRYRTDPGVGPLGSYDPSTRTIEIAMANATSPTRQDALTLLHEIAHSVMENLPENLQLAVHNAIQRLPEGELAFYGSADAQSLEGMSTERRVKEIMAEHLAFQGYDKAQATGIIDQIIRTFKDLMLRAAMYLQSSLLGENNVNERVALAWAENHFARIVAGDKLVSSLDGFGKIPSTRTLSSIYHRDVPVHLEYEDGVINYRTLADMSDGSAQYNSDAATSPIEEAEDNYEIDELDEDLKSEGLAEGRSLSSRMKDAFVIRALNQARIDVAAAKAVQPYFNQILEQTKKVNNVFTDAQRKLAREEGRPIPENITTMEELFALLPGMPNPFKHERAAKEAFMRKLEAKKIKADIDPFADIDIDKLPEAERSAAELTVYHTIKKVNQKLIDLSGDNTDTQAKLEAKADLYREQLADVLRNPYDWQAQHTAAVQEFRRMLAKIPAEIARPAFKDGKHAGETTALLAALLDAQGMQQKLETYTDKVFEKLDIEETSIKALFESLFAFERKSGLILADADRSEVVKALIDEVAASPDTEVAKLLNSNRTRGSAILSAMLSLIRQRSLLGEMVRNSILKTEDSVAQIKQLHEVMKERNEAKLSLIRQRSLLGEMVRNSILKTEDSVAQLKQLHEVMKERNESKLSELRTKLNELGGRGPRLIQSALNRRDKALKNLTALAKTKQVQAILEAMTPAAAELSDRIAQRLEISPTWDLTNGADVMLPPNANASDDEVKASVTKLHLFGDNRLSQDQWLGMLKQMDEWLDSRRKNPEKQTVVYRRVKEQFEKMRVHVMGGHINSFRSGFFSGPLSGVADLALRSGTNAGKAVAGMMSRVVGLERRWANRDLVVGKQFEALRERLIKAGKVNVAEFMEGAYQRLHRLMQNGVFTGDLEDNWPAIYNKLRQEYRWLDNKDARTAMREMAFWIRDTGLAYNNEKAEQSGYDSARVKDDRLGEATTRRRIDRGVTGMTTTRHLAQDMTRWIGNLHDSTAALESLKTIKEDMREDPSKLEALRQKMASVMDASAKQYFLEPLMFDERGYFTQPTNSDGYSILVDPDQVRDLWAASRGDIIRMLESIYDANPSETETRTDFIARQVNHVVKDWMALREFTGAGRKRNALKGVVGLSHYGIDAREQDHWPDVWFEYASFTPDALRAATQQIVATAVFGRDAKQLQDQLDQINSELQSTLTKEGVPTKESDWEQLRRKNRKQYNRLQAMQEMSRQDFWGTHIEALFEHERDMITDNTVLMATFNVITANMLTGLKSAIRNLIGPTAWTTLMRSHSAGTWAEVVASYASMGRIVASGLLQTFGLVPMANDPYARLIADSGRFDVATKLSFMDLVRGEWGAGDKLQGGGIGKKIVRRSRQLTRILSLAKVGAVSSNSVLPAIRLNPFAYTQELTNYTLLYRGLKMYDGMVQRIADFYAAHPDRAGTAVTHADIKFRDEAAFESLKEAAYVTGGFRPEDLALKLMKARERGDSSLNYMGEEVVAGVHNIVTTNMTLEGCFNNRPLIASKSRLGRMAFTFVGWPIAQASQVIKTMEDPGGRADLFTAMKGMKVLALSTLPMAVAFGVMLDEYDEWLGKKQPRRDISSGDPAAYWDQIAQSGVLGIIGDVTDTVANSLSGTGRNTLSLDERIVAVNVVRNLIGSVRDMIQLGEGNITYATAGRRMLAAAGGNGMLQNMLVADKLFGTSKLGGIFEQESSIASRTNINNWLRIAGANIDMELDSVGGRGGAINPVTPHITNMVLASLRDDSTDFQAAYKRALEEAVARGEPDPIKYVRQRFADRNPLKSVFRSTPSAREYQRMLDSLPVEGRTAVEEGMTLINRYTMRIGGTPFQGSVSLSEKQMLRARQPAKPGMLERLVSMVTASEI